MRHIALAGTVLAALALSLPGCGRSSQRDHAANNPSPAKPAISAADAHQHALAAWEAWHATDGCSGPERNAFIAAIGRLKDDSAKWAALEKDFPREAWIARERHASVAFAFAEGSFDRGCHADAQRMFQHLLEFYPGQAQTGLRHRARFGLENAQNTHNIADVPAGQ